ncbi:jg21508 [Pararge aegeria aegeria]|uniref:Jg21508 protein n=1 Tax=Pararge aegeria aegeria TaxID=348720 RepID=A0A8S4RPC0_9NEOP|nr:jg21508 [Pararge aegeria aegeria]
MRAYRHIDSGGEARATHFRRDGFAGIGAGASKEVAKFGRRRARVNPFEYNFSMPTWEWTNGLYQRGRPLTRPNTISLTSQYNELLAGNLSNFYIL